MKWQKGDSFDISIALVSLLVGVGFDAYVVIGKAPKDITICNESSLDYKNHTKGEIKDEVIEKHEFADLGCAWAELEHGGDGIFVVESDALSLFSGEDR